MSLKSLQQRLKGTPLRWVGTTYAPATRPKATAACFRSWFSRACEIDDWSPPRQPGTNGRGVHIATVTPTAGTLVGSEVARHILGAESRTCLAQLRRLLMAQGMYIPLPSVERIYELDGESDRPTPALSRETNSFFYVAGAGFAALLLKTLRHGFKRWSVDVQQFGADVPIHPENPVSFLVPG